MHSENERARRQHLANPWQQKRKRRGMGAVNTGGMICMSRHRRQQPLGENNSFLLQS